MLRLAKSLIGSLSIFCAFSLFNFALAAVPANPSSGPTSTHFNPSINQTYRIEYNAVSRGVAYQLYEREGANGSWVLIEHSGNLYRYTAHSRAGEYYYTYRSLNSDGYSGFSPTTMVVVGTVPSTPSSPSSSSGSWIESGVNYQISWSSDAQATVYDLHQQVSSVGSYNQIYWGGNTAKTLSSSPQYYYYKYRQCNALGCSGFGSSKVIQVYGTPTAVSNLTSSVSSIVVGNQLQLTWTKHASQAGGIAYYNAKVTLPSGTTSDLPDITNGNQQFLNVVPNSGAGTYTYFIQACNGKESLCSAWSNVSVTATTPPPPSNQSVQGSVWINGSPIKGNTLTVSNNLSDGNGLGSFSYQWKRSGSNISGATGASYSLVQADVGSKISIAISFTDGDGYAESVTSPQTATVTVTNTPPTGSVTIEGDHTVGTTLTASNTISDPDGLGTFTYQWLRNGVNIAGATSDTYTLTSDDVGYVISVKVSYADGGGTTENVSSSATPQVIIRVKYTYDALGRLRVVTDKEGVVHEYDYDAAGNRDTVRNGN